MVAFPVSVRFLLASLGSQTAEEISVKDIMEPSSNSFQISWIFGGSSDMSQVSFSLLPDLESLKVREFI